MTVIATSTVLTLDAARRARGFTLIEIMVVVVILGILAALVAPNVIRRIDDAQIAKAKQDIRPSRPRSTSSGWTTSSIRPPTRACSAGRTARAIRPIRNWKPGGYLERRRAQGSLGQRLPLCVPRHARRIRSVHARRRRQEGGEGNNADIGNWNIEWTLQRTSAPSRRLSPCASHALLRHVFRALRMPDSRCSRFWSSSSSSA